MRKSLIILFLFLSILPVVGFGKASTSATTARFTDGVILNSNILLEGLYNGNPLNNVLYLQGLSVDPDDADYVTISALDENPPHNVIDQQQGVLKTNGDVSVTFGPAVIPNNFYYLKVTNRNHVAIWSSDKVFLTPITIYIFSDAAGKAFGDNQTETHGSPGDPGDGFGYALYEGDLNQDGAVDGFDFLILDPDIQNGNGGYLVTDVDGNGSVDATDFLWLIYNIQIGAGIINPFP